MSGRDELLEAASFLEVHGVLPQELATDAVRAVVEPMLPGDAADIVVALQLAAEPAPPMDGECPSCPHRVHPGRTCGGITPGIHRCQCWTAPPTNDRPVER